MSRFFLNILTSIDNQSFEAGRVLWVFGSLAFIIASCSFQAFALYRGQTFSMVEFGTGFGGGLASILALGGIGIAQKDKALQGVNS